MPDVRSGPCLACPYRRDVAPAVWSLEDYAKLPPYDEPTGEQPLEAFSCHATPEELCHGWAVVHSNRGHDRELLSLRLLSLVRAVRVPERCPVPLFPSGRAAAEHGLRAATPRTASTVRRLLRKYPRLSS